MQEGQIQKVYMLRVSKSKEHKQNGQTYETKDNQLREWHNHQASLQ